MFERLRKYRISHNHKRGSELLMDMLPAGKSAPPAIPLSKEHSGDIEQKPILDTSTVREVEADNIRAPELDAEAPGPHILEIETLEPISELESQRHIAELDGRNRSYYSSAHPISDWPHVHRSHGSWV